MKKGYFILLILWLIVILVLLLMPANSLDRTPLILDIEHLDKIVHFVLFGVLSFLVLKNMQYMKNPKINVALLTIIMVSSFGIVTEILQLCMHNITERFFSVADIICDTVASMTVVFCCTELSK